MLNALKPEWLSNTASEGWIMSSELLLDQRPGLLGFHVVLVGQATFHVCHGSFCSFCKQIACIKRRDVLAGRRIKSIASDITISFIQQTEPNLLSVDLRWGCGRPPGTSRPLWPAVSSEARPACRQTLRPHRSPSCWGRCRTSAPLHPSPAFCGQTENN